MDGYESMMDNQLPATGQAAVGSYQAPVSFPQFPDSETMNSAYGNLPGMAGSYPSTPTTPGNSMNMGGYSTPISQQSAYGGLSSSSSSFSMPYDPPSMSGRPTLPMVTPPQPQSNKPIYSCTYCGLVLSSNNALIEHKRIHTGERPFACHICDKRFTQKAHLNIHKRIHTGEKPYPCHICHKRFAQSSHLSSHKRIHTGEKPFVCGICHIGFTQKQRLDAHLKKHMERPGQDIGPHHQNRHSNMMTQPTRMDAFPQGAMRDDSHNFMHLVGQGMPYIKQESGVSDIHSNNALRPNLDLSGPNDEEKSMGRLGMNRDLTGVGGHSEMEERESARVQSEEDVNGADENRPGTNKSPKIAAPSFSSEGMFLHPSGYVAYGGIEDSEESQDNSPPDTRPDNTEHPPQQQGSNLSTGGHGHRRKPSVVRKRYSESPVKDDDAPKLQNEECGDAVNGIHKFHALNQNMDQNSDVKEGSVGMDENETEDYEDNGEHLDDKNDPPYHGSGHGRNDSQNTSLRKSGPEDLHATIETRSHSRRTNPNHSDMSNLDKMNPSGMGGETLSYSGLSNSHGNSGLVKINNRISLVNFTADELIAHLMKRDDVHRCQFCCLIFQDAAMYHIHRNMHDKQDIRRCNMCGKLLLDKYDFTAHFLSMHQS